MQLFKKHESEGKKYQTIEKIAFEVVQIKFLTIHNTYQKLCFDIFMVGKLLHIYMVFT